LATGDALGAALAILPEIGAAAPGRRRRVLSFSLAAAALAAAVLAVFLLRSRAEPGVAVRTVEGAVSFAEEPGRARLDDGKASFTVDRSPFVVDTPLGAARCENGAFTLSVAREGGNDSMDKKRAALAVTIAVTAGAVWWAAGGHEVELSKGSTWVEREPSANAPAPDLAALEPPGSAPSPEQRAPVLAESAPEISAAPADAAAAGPDPRFEIFGRVVDAETGEALPGAHVVLGARRDRSRTFEAVANSGADGGFRASSIAVPGGMPIRPGVYTDPFFVGTFLTAQAEGYSPRFEVPWERFHAGSALDAREPIDLGEIRLHRGARIAGRVVDEHGAPVPDAALLLSEDLPGSAAFSPATSEAVGRSAADGSFSLERRVAPAEPYSKVHLFAVCPLGIGWAALDVLEAKREMGGIEVKIGAPARLEVLVQDREGRPIEGAEVRLEPRFGPLITPRYGRRHDHAMFFGPRPDVRAIVIAATDTRGRARFDRLPTVDSDGSYDVVVSAEGFARDWKDDVLVLASHDTNVAIGLEAYRPRSISGAVRTEEGAAVAGAKLETHSRGAMVAATSDAAGAYRLEGLDPSIETGWFMVSAPGFVEQNRSLPFSARGDLEGIDSVLERPEPIAGRVVDQDGRPVAGARPHLHRGNEWRRMSGEQGRTGADGAFRFDDAAAGAWTLQVQPPEPATEWRSAYTMLEVKGGEQSLEVVLERATNEGARVV
ncbi:MAG TPA: carboxypeptidase-like regulatory domain-containing protein, partial [Myxococcota bacterium]|nr:carboxypeptidase-like regulatory domain-containing protein [Myxococcota bacterium]